VTEELGHLDVKVDLHPGGQSAVTVTSQAPAWQAAAGVETIRGRHWAGIVPGALTLATAGLLAAAAEARAAGPAPGRRRTWLARRFRVAHRG